MLSKIKKITLYVVSVYAVLGFVILPLVLKPQIIDIVQNETNAKISIDDIDFNPFSFRLDIFDLNLSSADDSELVYVNLIRLNIQPSSLFFATLHVKELIVKEPRISLVLYKDKRVNFASILKPDSKPKPKKQDDSKSTIPRMILDRVAVVDGTIDYEDYTQNSRFDFKFENIGFELKDIDTRDLNTSDANIRFYTLLEDGGFVDFKSEVIALEPLQVKGSLEFEASKLYTQWRYIKDSLNLEVADGRISLYSDYYLNLSDLNETILSNINIKLQKLRVKPKEADKDVLNLESLDIKNATLKPIKQNLHIQKIALESLDMKLKRDKDGNFDWLEYLEVASSSESNKSVQKEDSNKTQQWSIAVDEVALEKIKVDFQDKAMIPSLTTLLELNSLKTDFYANIITKETDSKTVADVGSTNLSLDKFLISKKHTSEKLIGFKTLNLSEIALNTKAKDINITDITMENLFVLASRDKSGKLNVDGLAVPQKKAIVKKPAGSDKEEDYRVRIKKAALKSSTLSFRDKSLEKQTSNKLNNLYITAFDIDSKKYSWMKYRLSTRVNNIGRIRSEGAIRHTPLKQRGAITVDKVSLKEFTPYLKEHAYLYIDEGYVSLKAKTEYEVLKKKPDLNVNGSFKLQEVFINDSRDKTSLISFSDIDLKKFTFEMFPNRVYVDEVDINSFYVNAIVDANKSMNFASLLKQKDDENLSLESTDENTSKEDSFATKIMKVNISNGSAHFSDLSLPIKFKTNIHDLNGVLYTLSSASDETSYVDISGEVDRYGSTKLKGSVNAGAPKVFTDLNFNFRNLDLSSVSGYSASFAGYEIDDGKMFLNLNYKISDSKLLGENSIIIKKIELGKKVENKDGNSLPLGFVVGLLEDDEGVIDIDIPVEGNVDEPDFKYGALVFKTFVKLIFKAATSPFTFLASMMGLDGEKMGYAEFEGGSSTLLPPEQEKFDNIAKMLLKRPKINLSIAGGYNLEIDKKSIQKIKLEDLVVKRSGAKNEKEKISAMSIDLLEDIYEDARDDDRLDEIEDALEEKYKGDELKREYLLALIEECTKIQDVSLEDIHTLAIGRSAAIKSYLRDTKGVDSSRIIELEIQELQSDKSGLVRTKLDVIVK